MQANVTPGLTAAVFAAVCFGLYQGSQSLASKHISSAIGAAVISGTAVLVGILYLAVMGSDEDTTMTWHGLGLVALAGAFAFFADFLALYAYSKNVPVSVGGPIIIGGGIAAATVVGLLVGESFSFLKVLGVGLVAIGASILGHVD